MRQSLILLKLHYTRYDTAYNMHSWIALLIAIMYPAELTVEQAFAKAYNPRYIPKPRKIREIKK